MDFKDKVDDCVNVDYKKKDLGDIARKHTSWGALSDVDSGKTGKKDGVEKAALGTVKMDKGTGVAINKLMIVDEAKKGTGGTVEKSLIKPNKLGLPTD